MSLADAWLSTKGVIISTTTPCYAHLGPATQAERQPAQPPAPSYPEFAIWTSSSHIVCFSCPGHNEFAARAGPSEISGVQTVRFCPSDEPRLLPRNRFLRHYSDPPPSAPDFAAAIGVLPARHRQRPDPPQHLAKQPPRQMTLRQEQPIIAGMFHQPTARLHQPLLLSRKTGSWESLGASLRSS